MRTILFCIQFFKKETRARTRALPEMTGQRFPRASIIASKKATKTNTARPAYIRRIPECHSIGKAATSPATRNYNARCNIESAIQGKIDAKAHSLLVCPGFSLRYPGSNHQTFDRLSRVAQPPPHCSPSPSSRGKEILQTYVHPESVSQAQALAMRETPVKAKPMVSPSRVSLHRSQSFLGPARQTR